jgi:hypothetical protein
VRERELRKKCRQLLRDLDIRPPLDVTELCRRVGERRGRPIILVSHPIPVPGPFGLWITATECDYVLYQRETSKSHQDHIILHELGHLLAGHHGDIEARGGTGLDPESLRDQYPDLDPDAVRRALRRTSYDTEQEREAETVATIILEWASVLDKVSPHTPRAPMDSALASRIGWLQ